jgi:hypothetical protein
MTRPATTDLTRDNFTPQARPMIPGSFRSGDFARMSDHQKVSVELDARARDMAEIRASQAQRPGDALDDPYRWDDLVSDPISDALDAFDRAGIDDDSGPDTTPPEYRWRDLVEEFGDGIR